MPGATAGLRRGGERAPRKKLAEAARAWAVGPTGPRPPSEEELADLERFGASAEEIEARRQHLEALAAEADRVEVHDDCWESFQVFLCCDTQWRHAQQTMAVPGGGAVTVPVPTGLDLQGVLAVLRFLGHKPGKALFADLKVMERAVLDAEREKRERRA